MLLPQLRNSIVRPGNGKTKGPHHRPCNDESKCGQRSSMEGGSTQQWQSDGTMMTSAGTSARRRSSPRRAEREPGLRRRKKREGAEGRKGAAAGGSEWHGTCTGTSKGTDEGNRRRRNDTTKVHLRIPKGTQAPKEAPWQASPEGANNPRNAPKGLSSPTPHRPGSSRSATPSTTLPKPSLPPTFLHTLRTRARCIFL